MRGYTKTILTNMSRLPLCAACSEYIYRSEHNKVVVLFIPKGDKYTKGSKVLVSYHSSCYHIKNKSDTIEIEGVTIPKKISYMP